MSSPPPSAAAAAAASQLVVCEEIFDETSHPSEAEVREYALKLGIDPEAEPQLLPLAADGLMQALPPGWKPLYDDKSKGYYYYNNTTGKTQWEHPLDDVYRGLVYKTRTESQSLSLGEPLEDATYNRDDIPSYEEPVVSLNPIGKKMDIKLSPLKTKTTLADFSRLKLNKQKSEERPGSAFGQHKISLSMFNSFDDKKDNRIGFDKHPRGLEKSEFKLSGGGSMFLKSNTKKSPQITMPAPISQKPIVSGTPPRGILREKSFTLDGDRDHSSAAEDRMHVRFNLDKKPEIKFSYSDDKSSNSSEEDDLNVPLNDKGVAKKEAKATKPNRFTVSPVIDPLFLSESQDEVNNCKTIGKGNLKLIKPNASDFITPKLGRIELPETSPKMSEESEEDSVIKSIEERIEVECNSTDNKLEGTLGSDVSMNCSPEIEKQIDIFVEMHKTEMPSKEKTELENASPSDKDSQSENLKQQLILNKEREMEAFKQELKDEKKQDIEIMKLEFMNSKKRELESILSTEKTKYEEKIKKELAILQSEMEEREKVVLDTLRTDLSNKLEERKLELEKDFQSGMEQLEVELQLKLENQKKQLNTKFEDQVKEIEKEIELTLDERKKDVSFKHNSVLDVLKKEHASYIDELKRNFKSEEQLLKRDHQTHLNNVREKFANEIEAEKNRSRDGEDRMYEKMRCEKRLLEDKYKCLKEKYLRLKGDVKLSIEKRSKKREQSLTTTGSETERTHSNKKDKTPSNSPAHRPTTAAISTTPTHQKHPKSNSNRHKGLESAGRSSRPIVINLDASLSDRNSNTIDANLSDLSEGQYANAASQGRTRKKFFTRLKSNSTSRLNNRASREGHLGSPDRPCSPVENLRRQLQKLEDLEDQFPQNPQTDTCHIRYPFSDVDTQYGGELEFFRHRIHLERDSVKRAKETLRSQRTAFQQRQRQLKLKHGNAARGTLQQLLQEEKELSDMEVSLHRTRSLLGEKVIRLRHLEQSLHRATVPNDHGANSSRQDDATLSDLSSHSASSGISSSDFGTGDGHSKKHLHVNSLNLQESSEIMQSLENLNTEIREIWEVLNKQQQGNITTVIPPISLMYPDLGWPLLSGAMPLPTAPPSIPTLADRLNNYQQQAALANAQSTMVTHATQGATTTLVERTRNLRHWLRQVGVEASEGTTLGQATL